MKNKFLGCIVACMVFTQAAQATVILSQTPALNVAFASDISATVPQIVADDFNLASNQFVRTVKWQGFYLVGTTIPTDEFTLKFYAANALGEVGAVLNTFNVANNVNRTGTSQLFPFGPVRHELFEYSVDLGIDLALGDGKFWLSIANDTANDPTVDWSWAGRSPSFFGDPNAYDSAFSRNGQTFFGTDIINYLVIEGGTVPEPSTMLLLALSLAGCGIFRRRTVAS